VISILLIAAFLGYADTRLPSPAIVLKLKADERIAYVGGVLDT